MLLISVADIIPHVIPLNFYLNYEFMFLMWLKQKFIYL